MEYNVEWGGIGLGDELECRAESAAKKNRGDVLEGAPTGPGECKD